MQDNSITSPQSPEYLRATQLAQMMHANSQLGSLFVSAVAARDEVLAGACVDFAKTNDCLQQLRVTVGLSSSVASYQSAFEVAVVRSDAALMSWLVDSGLSDADTVYTRGECSAAIKCLISRLPNDDVLSSFLKADWAPSLRFGSAITGMQIFKDGDSYFISTQYNSGEDSRFSKLAAANGVQPYMDREFLAKVSRVDIGGGEFGDKNLGIFPYCCAAGMEKSLEVLEARGFKPDRLSFQALMLTERWDLMRKLLDRYAFAGDEALLGETAAQRIRSSFWSAVLGSKFKVEEHKVRAAIDVALSCGLSFEDHLYGVSDGDRRWRQPIHFCANATAVRECVNRGADINVVEELGGVLLTHALRDGVVGEPVAIACLESGANASGKDSRGRSFKQLSVHSSDRVKQLIASSKASKAIDVFFDELQAQPSGLRSASSRGMSL